MKSLKSLSMAEEERVVYVSGQFGKMEAFDPEAEEWANIERDLRYFLK